MTQKTIILADDDAMFRLLMSRHLTALGFEVIEEENGKNVQRHIKQHDPVACIVDIVMDEKEGLETIAEIMALPKRPRIIAVSSNEWYLSFASEMGADGTLKKPVSPATLAATLQQVGVLSAI